MGRLFACCPKLSFLRWSWCRLGAFGFTSACEVSAPAWTPVTRGRPVSARAEVTDRDGCAGRYWFARTTPNAGDACCNTNTGAVRGKIRARVSQKRAKHFLTIGGTRAHSRVGASLGFIREGCTRCRRWCASSSVAGTSRYPRSWSIDGTTDGWAPWGRGRLSPGRCTSWEKMHGDDRRDTGGVYPRWI